MFINTALIVSHLEYIGHQVYQLFVAESFDSCGRIHGLLVQFYLSNHNNKTRVFDRYRYLFV